MEQISLRLKNFKEKFHGAGIKRTYISIGERRKQPLKYSKIKTALCCRFIVAIATRLLLNQMLALGLTLI